MEFRAFIKEDFQQWSGRWIHYSHEPYMKINYRTMWNDPLGIYLFPEKFEGQTQGGWHTYPYKFIVELPENIRVFDLSKYADEQFKKILADNGITSRKYYDGDPDYPHWSEHLRKLKPSDRFWGTIEDNFASRNGQNEQGRKAKINKFFRNMGYDAIFDDTNAIHSGEVQLVLLDPTIKYKVIDVQRRRGTGWEEMDIVCQKVAELCKSYGKVSIKKENKKFSGWSNSFVLKARIGINDDQWKEGPYVGWELYTITDSTNKHQQHQRPSKIVVSLSGATPRLPELFNSSISAHVSLRTMDFTEVEKIVRSTMEKIFSSH